MGKGLARVLAGVVDAAARRLREERGNVAVIAAGGLVALMGFTALSADVGRGYLARQRLQDVADAAALAGAGELPDQAAAAQAAREVAARNGVDAALVQVSFPDSHTIRVDIEDSVRFFFAPALNAALRTVEVRAHAVAGAGGVRAVGPQRASGGGSGADQSGGGNGNGRGSGGSGGGSGSGGRDGDGTSDGTADDERLEEAWEEVRSGLVPLGVEWADFTLGQLVALKVGPGGASGGNFHALQLSDDPGASRYRENLMYGYDGFLQVGDQVATEPGNMSGPTQDGVGWRIGLDPSATWDTVRPGSPRLLIVPVVSPFQEVNGRQEVTVLGFAAFFLEGVDADGTVYGRFLRWRIDGEPGGPDYGLSGVRLKE